MRRLALVGLAMLTLGLVGCSTAPFDFAVFAEPQKASDELPGEVAESLSLKADSSRLLGEDEGFTFYLAYKGDDVPRQMCLVAVGADPGDAGASCSSGGGGMTMTVGNGPRAKVISDGSAGDQVPDGWHSVHPNLIVAD